MADAAVPLVVAEDPQPNVRVARFVRPEYRAEYLDPECPDIRDTPLYQEFRRRVLDDLGPGRAVVVNLGLLNVFNSALFRLLLQVNKDVGGRVLFCCLTPIAREAWDVMSGDKTFPGQVRGSESRAVYDAKQG